MSDIMDKLQQPFSPNDIEWRVGSTTQDKSKGLALAYVTNRAIQSRLDEVFGPFGWQNQFKEWKNNSQICGISVWCEDKKEWITKWDGADDSQTEAVKGGLSDSMKRAAVQWGIGRYLYKLDAQWAKLKPQGKSYVLAETPKLPAWAAPDAQKPVIAEQPKSNTTFREGQQEVSKMRQAEKKAVSSSQSPAKISESQIKSLYTKCTKDGLTHDDVHGIIDWKFGIKSVKDLNIPDFAYLFNNIDKVWADYVAEKSKTA